MLNSSNIIKLYEKYKEELFEVRNELRQFCKEHIPKGFRPQLCDVEGELTYMFIRELKSKNVVEFSPCHGYSTMWLLHALNKNDKGKVFSFDLIDEATKYIPISLRNRWEFIKGDVKDNLDKFPEQIDYLFIDSDHSKEFCKWYIENIFPMLRNGVYVSVHDIIKRNNNKRHEEFKYGESDEIIGWLSLNQIPFYTAGWKNNIADVQTIDNNAFDIINMYRRDNDLYTPIFQKKSLQRNSMIFFNNEDK